MNFDHDLFGEDRFYSDDPMPDHIVYDGQQLVDGLDDEMVGIPYDNSLVVPMDDSFEYPPNGTQGDSRDFQILQPPVSAAYDMDLGHSQSSMGMGGYSNGATNEALLYEQSATISNGDHHMMGVSEEHYGGMPSTSFGGYQPSPMTEHQPSPSVSRGHSRPSSRSTAPKGGGGGAIAQHLNAPSSSSYANSPTPSAKPTPTKKANAARPANGSRTKKAQGANTVGAVLSKANKLAANPPAATNTLQLSAEDTQKVAMLSMEIAKLEKDPSLHAKTRVDELTKQRAQIFVLALTAQQNVNVNLLNASVATPAPRPRPQKKQQQHQQQHQQHQPPSSPGYTPQCGTMYTPTGHDGYSAVPGPSHGGYMPTPTGPQSMHQRGTMYKVTSAGPPHAGPRGINGVAAGAEGMGGAPPLFLQQQQHGQPPPQMVISSSTTATSTPSSTMTMGRRGGGAGSRTMMVRGGLPQSLQQPLPVQQLQQPPMQQHPGLAQHPPGTTVRAALKQGGLQHLQQLNHHQQQPQLQQGPMQHAQLQQHRSSPMPSTSTAHQPQPLLQLSLPVQQQPQPIRMDDPFRQNPQVVARRIEEKRQGRKQKLQNAFEVMSQALLNPETEKPFTGVDDVFRRLIPYHLLYEHDLDPQLEEEFDLQFMRAMVEADEGKRRITERMRKIAIDEAIARKDEERNLLLFLDAEYEKQRLEEEKKISKENPDALQPIARATALALSAATPLLPPPSDRLKELKKPEDLSTFTLYEYHPFVERRRIPTPPPVGKFHGLEESEVEDETEDEGQDSAGPSSSSAPIPASAIKRSPSSDDEASPEMGWPADDLPQKAPPPSTVSHLHRPATVPSHHPLTMPDRKVKLEVASPRPAAAAGKVQPTQPIKQEVASPARTKHTVSSRATVPKYEMPEAIPVPLAKRNRMMEDRMKEEERRKKVEERERKEAEERRRKEDERKERERRKKEEERLRAEENKREEEERRVKEEKERREREEMEKRRKEEEGERKVIAPIKLKIKMAVREEEKKEEEAEKRGQEEKERKSKKKRKKEKRERGENDEEERERKKRKREKKERERQAAAADTSVVEAAPAAASTTMTPAIPKLKIKFGGATPAATPAAAAAVTPQVPVLPVSVPSATPVVRASAAAVPPSTPVQQLQQSQAPPPPMKLKIRLGGPPAASSTPSPSTKEERRREKEERRKENGHHKEKHHHKHKEHKSEKRHREQQQSQSQPLPAAAAPAAPPQPQASSQPAVPSFKINMALQRPAPVALPTVSTAAAATMQHVQQQMAMNAPPQLFRPSVIAAPPQLQMQQLQQNALAAAMGLHQQQLLQQPQLQLAPVIPPAAPPFIPGLGRLPPGPEEKSPPRIEFSDSEDEDVQRSNSLHESAAAITRMVGHAQVPMLPPHHHLLPQLHPSPFPWNNQYQ